MNARITTAILASSILMGCGGGSSTGKIDPPIVPDTDTIPYDATNFVDVNVNGSFDVTIRQSNSFRVVITIDSTEANKLDVGVDGNTLNIGFIPNVDVRAVTLEAVIEMPMIEAINLTGSNNATLIGFTGVTLGVSIDGSNVLQCQNSTFDYVIATVSGSSLLEFANVTPLPAAHVDLSGSTSTTLNLMDFATVTGSLSGTSALFYYGSNINLQLTVANSSSITRLGGTQ